MVGLRERANSLLVFSSGLGATIAYTLETYSGVVPGEQIGWLQAFSHALSDFEGLRLVKQ